MFYSVLVLFSVFTLSSAKVVSTPLSAACTCSSGFVPVPVDVTLPVDPWDPLGLNSTKTFKLRTTFNVYGELCQPTSPGSKFSDSIQLLLHGATYTSDYWDIRWNGFQNYSYIAHSCNEGISSYAFDSIGAGRTTRPRNSKECQLPTAADVTSSLGRDLKNGRISRILTGHEKKYSKVIGIGHSLGSLIMSYGVLRDGKSSPLDGIVITGFNFQSATFDIPPPSGDPASQVNPARFPNLDPGYITTLNISTRAAFYSPSPSAFSSDVLQLDEVTKDVASTWITAQVSFVNEPVRGFKGHVAEFVGSLDQIFCLRNGGPCNQTELQMSDAHFYPDTKDFQAIVLDGFGHVLNLEFGAAEAFSIMTGLFKKFVR